MILMYVRHRQEFWGEREKRVITWNTGPPAENRTVDIAVMWYAPGLVC